MIEHDKETGEVIEAHAEIVPATQGAVTLFRSDDPAEVLERASKVAAALSQAVKAQGLVSNIQGKEYVNVEGWTLLGSLLGVFPVPTEKVDLPNGYEVKVEARARDGAVVGAAWARCTRDEKTWANRPDYALLSMAQTRATSKAMRLPLGFVMRLAGFDPTPADEVPPGGFSDKEHLGAPVQQIPEGRSGKANPASKDAPGSTNAPKPDSGATPIDRTDYVECPTCHKRAVLLNPTEGAETYAFCRPKAGGCNKKYAKKVWDIVSVPGPSSLDPLPTPARHEAPADVQDLTDESNLPF